MAETISISRANPGGRRPPDRPARGLLAFVLSLLVLAAPGFSNSLFLGIHGGLSLPNMHGHGPQSEGYVSRRAPFLGVTAEYLLGPRLSLCAELNYASQGGLRRGMQPITAGQLSGSGMTLPLGMTLYASFRNEAILDYLEIPLMARLTWGGNIRFFVQGGPYVGFRMRAVTETRGSSQLFIDASGTPFVNPYTGSPLPAMSFDADTDVKRDIRSTTAGVTGGAGLIYRFGPGDVLLDARFELGLTNVQVDTVLNGENQTGGLVFIVGYRFGLGGRR